MASSKELLENALVNEERKAKSSLDEEIKRAAMLKAGAIRYYLDTGRLS